MTALKLLWWTVAIVVISLLINVGGGLYWPAGQQMLMISTVIILICWFLFFTGRIIYFYLWPRSLYEEVFAGLGFKQSLWPTKEIYEGRYENIPVKCEILKGRDRTNAYIYLTITNKILLAASQNKPLQISTKMHKIKNLPKELENYIILSEQPDQALVH